jgi:hypothetical protein
MLVPEQFVFRVKSDSSAPLDRIFVKHVTLVSMKKLKSHHPAALVLLVNIRVELVRLLANSVWLDRILMKRD